MKRSTIAVLLLCICLPLLSGCTAASNPLTKAEATPVPGQPQELHSASSSTTSEFEATLYYRFLDSNMLAGESRVLAVKKDESNELAVIKAFLDGPSAERTDLRRLFEGDVSVLNASASGDTLFITLNEAFLHDSIPADWKQSDDWSGEAPTRRMLTVQSLVNTVTENFNYHTVQLLIAMDNDPKADSRLDRSYFLTGQTGPTDPLTRDEHCLLTSYRTAQLLLQAWNERDYETLFTFTASYVDYEAKPNYQSFITELDTASALSAFEISPGNISENGQNAVLTLSLSVNSGGTVTEMVSYPLRLVRENGIWKITWSALRKLMLK